MGTLLVGVADPVVDRLGVAGFKLNAFCHPLAHQLASGRRADHVDLIVHGRRDGCMVKRCPQLLRVARIGIDEHDQQLPGHAAAPASCVPKTNASVPISSRNRASQHATSLAPNGWTTGSLCKVSVNPQITPPMTSDSSGTNPHASARQ